MNKGNEPDSLVRCGCLRLNCQYALDLKELMKPRVVLPCAGGSVGRCGWEGFISVLQPEKGWGWLNQTKKNPQTTPNNGEGRGGRGTRTGLHRFDAVAAPLLLPAAPAERGAGGTRSRRPSTPVTPPNPPPHHHPPPPGLPTPRSSQGRAPANAQLLLPDLESWGLFAVHILKGQRGASVFGIITEGKKTTTKHNPTADPKPWCPGADFGEECNSATKPRVVSEQRNEST